MPMRALALLLLLALLAPEAPAQPASGETASIDTATGVEDPALNALVADWWTWRLEQDPLYASYVGEHAYDDRLQDVSPEARNARLSTAQGFRQRLSALVETTPLAGEDAITAQIMGTLLDDEIAAHRFGAHRIPITASDGFHTYLTRLPGQSRFETVQDYAHYIQRLQAWPAHVGQQIANMREGIETGFVLPRAPLAGVPASIRANVVEDPEASAFWEPFTRIPATVSDGERQRLQALGRNVIRNALVPGYAAFLAFMTDEYFPAAREAIGASAMPDGEAYYAWRVRHFTTMDTTPEAVHQIGLAEVARIRGEMQAVLDEVEWTGTFAEFLDFLRTDPQFTAASPEALLQEGAWLAMQMNAELPRLFGRLPRLPYTVRPVPEPLAPTWSAGFYVEPPAGGLVPGVYWINTYDLSSRPTWALEALTFHEAVPGHHLQIALAQELDHLPAFRRALVLTAYEEGWGLYAESLGTEAGFYTDPYRRFGRLTYEMWRACRLVVDTGMHAFGWERQRTVDYLTEHTALSELEIQTETDRYIAWPGQALGYKMGELAIRRLRTEAETDLGADFDIRGFHDAVLTHGELPMATLETVVREWIAEEGASRQ